MMRVLHLRLQQGKQRYIPKYCCRECSLCRQWRSKSSFIQYLRHALEGCSIRSQKLFIWFMSEITIETKVHSIIYNITDDYKDGYNAVLYLKHINTTSSFNVKLKSGAYFIDTIAYCKTTFSLNHCTRWTNSILHTSKGMITETF